jgi:phenol 2-monooxygenase
MQFHLDGFRAGDPGVAVAAPEAAARGEALPETCDVLIVGCGPAGLTLAAQLSAFAGIKVCIVDQKPGPLQVGQADGVACRTMEMFQAFGFADRVLKECWWINETTFWKPDVKDKTRIARQSRVQDVEDGLSDFPHVILNQARVHDFYLDIMRNSAHRLVPHYNRRLASVEVDAKQSNDLSAGMHPVTATFERTDAGNEGKTETVKARFAVGCDGARSAVRQSIGRVLAGDSANQAWGVMDVLAVTDFPDIRKKVLIQSADEGSIVLIPREGGFMVRIYVELDKLNANERVASRNITVERLIAAAQRIFRPHSFDVKEVAWWSVYEIGQRVCDKFDDVPAADVDKRLPRVFIAGDACHTHSPKAGQGMNVSMQDAFNLGWKLGAVLQGRAKPELLHSYSEERQTVAADLIRFDREWAKMLSAPLKSANNPGGVEPEDVQRYYVQHLRYTAGTVTHYRPSALTGVATHQGLAKGFEIGTRLHSAPVIRLADARPMRLGDATQADGRFRIFIFGDRAPIAANSRLRSLCEFLAASPQSPVRRFTPPGTNIDSVIDVRCVLQDDHLTIGMEAVPAFLLPAKGRLGLQDYEKVFCPDLKSSNDIFDMRGIDRDKGCMVIVRPDQYIAHVLPLEAHGELAAYFERFLRPAG